MHYFHLKVHLKKNVLKTHLEEKVEIYPIGFEELLKNKLQEKPNITFIDPPYETDFGYKAVKIMLTRNLVDEDSILVIETDQEERLKKQLKEIEIEIVDERKYGRVHLIFLKPKRKG